MVSNLDPSALQFLANLNQIQTTMDRAETELSTGLRVSQVSDAPAVVSAILQARSSLASTQQINSNLTRVQSEVNTGEQGLQNAVQMFDQVQTLATEGDTSTQTASGRATIAQQLQSIEQ